MEEAMRHLLAGGGADMNALRAMVLQQALAASKAPGPAAAGAPATPQAPAAAASNDAQQPGVAGVSSAAGAPSTPGGAAPPASGGGGGIPLPCAAAGLLALGGKPGGAFNLGSFLKDLDSSDDSSDDVVPSRSAGIAAGGDELAPDDDVSLPADEPPADATGVGPHNSDDEESETPVDDDTLMKSMEFLALADLAWQQGNHFKALAVLGQAIESNPQQALLHSTRATYNLKLRRPKSTIQDCNTALGINPVSAQAHKVKGRAYGLLKKWDSAVHYLRLGNQLSYDESSYRYQKKAEAKCIEKRREELVKGQSAGAPPAG